MLFLLLRLHPLPFKTKYHSDCLSPRQPLALFPRSMENLHSFAMLLLTPLTFVFCSSPFLLCPDRVQHIGLSDFHARDSNPLVPELKSREWLTIAKFTRIISLLKTRTREELPFESSYFRKWSPNHFVFSGSSSSQE